jgi:hypothetical protein
MALDKDGNEIVDETIVDNAAEEAAAAAETEATAAAEAEAAATAEAEAAASEADDDIEDEKFLRIVAKKSGKTFESVEDIFKVAEPVEIIKNKYEKISPKAQGFLDFHSETGRDYEDYIALQQDVSTIPDIDLARERVRTDTGNPALTNDEVDAYLEKKLNIDLTDLADMDVADKIALSSFTKTTRENKIIEQEKYKLPLASQQQQAVAAEPLPDDMVELEGGQRMKKVDYEDLVQKRTDYLKNRTDAVDKIAVSEISITVDDNGTEKIVTYGYDYSAEDKQKMLSMTEDVNVTVGELFRTEKGFNHEGLAKGIWRLDQKNWEKEVSAIVQKAVAQNTEEIMKEIGNVKLGNEDMVTEDANKNKKIVPVGSLLG